LTLAVTVWVPISVVSVANTAELVLLPEVAVMAAEGAPPTSQENVSESFSESVDTTERFKLEPAAKRLPVDAGVCDAQTGGVFLTNVQLWLAAPTELVAVATRVFVPTWSAEPKSLYTSGVEESVTSTPFKVNFTVHDEELFTIENTFAIDEFAATRIGVVKSGENDLIVHGKFEPSPVG
jgi:hypothetical protein